MTTAQSVAAVREQLQANEKQYEAEWAECIQDDFDLDASPSAFIISGSTLKSKCKCIVPWYSIGFVFAHDARIQV